MSNLDDKEKRMRTFKRIKLDPPKQSDFKRLLEMARPEEKLCIALSSLYNLRRSEIAGLCGEDILWDMHSIYVHTDRVKTKDMEWVRKEMLPKSIRRIELAPEVMDMIPHVGQKDFVIRLNPDGITYRFERLKKKAKVTCHFHELRNYSDSIRSEIIGS